MKDVDQILFEMLTENTGWALCDSGNYYGRNYERNQKKTIEDFIKENSVTPKFRDGLLEYYTISVFHYLRNQLEIDCICEKFNKINIESDNWDDDRFYGVSSEGGKFLDKYNPDIQSTFNSYGASSLSQVIQGTYLRIADSGYVLLQIHGGCDVRSGYTTARLFVIENDYGGWLSPEDVCGTIILENADLKTPALPDCENIKQNDYIPISNTYDGCCLRNDNTNEKIEIRETDNLTLYLVGE